MRILNLLSKLVIMSLFLSGCATPPVVNTSITTFYGPEYRNIGSISVVAATTEQNDSLEFLHYKGKIEQKIASHGYKIVNNPTDAEFIALVAYGIDEGKNAIVSTPIFGQTGGGATFTSYGTSSYTMPSFGVVASSTNSETRYTRGIALDIVRAKDLQAGHPKKLFELRAKSVGICSSIAAVFDEMLESIFTEFPGESGKARKVTLQSKGDC